MTEQNLVSRQGNRSSQLSATEGDQLQQNGDSGDGNNEQQQQQEQQNQPTRMESFMAVTKSLIIRALVIYFISSFFRRPSQTPTVNSNDAQNLQQQNINPRVAAWNYFENGTIFDLYVYLSDNYDDVDFERSNNLIWLQEGLIYGDWYSGENSDGVYTHSIKIKANQQLMNNGSIYLHVYATKSGKTPNPNDGQKYAGPYMSHTCKMLNKYKRIRINRNYNLLTGDKKVQDNTIQDLINNQNENLQKDNIIISHWHPNLTINFVTDQTNWMQGSIPQPLDEYIQFIDNGKTYLPVLYLNDYWNMLRDYKPINETTPELDLYLTYQPLSMFKWQLYAAQQMKNKWTNNLFGDFMSSSSSSSSSSSNGNLLDDGNDEDQDSLKETLLETNPYLLGLTILISILHSIFELLAFKNDIQFWNNRKSLEGLSVRSVFFSVFQSIIVLLYVLDNETNFMIRVSCFIGLGIEIWKIHKVIDIKINRENPKKLFGIIKIPIEFHDKGSYIESSTKDYDNLAFKYLSWICFPLLFGYSIYSLIYNEHKGWYSFILNIFYGFLLTFGFIMMTPQLFINYKLKSVAHLPWRMMTYKFLNTFIDDIFAFVIKMPTMYRLGCFRDDIVFFIFLYQRWIYKVDHKRINEFGYSGEMITEIEKQKHHNNDNENAITDGTEIETSETNNATNGPTIIENEKTPKDKKRD